MNTEDKISMNLHKFSILDIILVKWTYISVALLVSTMAPNALKVSWIGYLLLALISGLPVLFHMFEYKGTFSEKLKHYIVTNTASLQALFFLTTLFSIFLLAVLFPVLTTVSWKIYLTLVIVFMIKPAIKVKFNPFSF